MCGLESTDLILDCMVGTGARGAPRAPFCSWIEAANATPAYRIAVDVPTGIDAETGERHQPFFEAAATISFVARKPAMALADAAKLFGEIEVVPIGIPSQLVERVLDENIGEQ